MRGVSRNNRAQKKGSIDLQFNWIFVLVAGIAILGVFLVQTQISTQRAQADANLVIREAIQTLIASPAEENYREVKLGTVALRNTCDEVQATIYVGRGLLPIYTTYHALHAPEVITSRTLQLQTFEGSTMLTGTDHEYIFVDDGNAGMLPLYNNFPGNKKLVTRLKEGDFPPSSGSLRYTMVYYFKAGDIKTIAPNSVRKPYDIIAFVEGGNSQANKIFFTSSDRITVEGLVDSRSAEWGTVGEAMGAIIDSDFQLYECLHDYELDKLERKYILLGRQQQYYAIEANISQSCKNLVGLLSTPIHDILITLDDSSSDRSSTVLLEIKDDINEIKRRNLDLARNNCPLLQ